MNVYHFEVEAMTDDLPDIFAALQLTERPFRLAAVSNNTMLDGARLHRELRQEVQRPVATAPQPEATVHQSEHVQEAAIAAAKDVPTYVPKLNRTGKKRTNFDDKYTAMVDEFMATGYLVGSIARPEGFTEPDMAKLRYRARLRGVTVYGRIDTIYFERTRVQKRK